MRPLRELTLILLALAGALLLSQLPGYVSAYEQRLGGAVDEARRTLYGFMMQLLDWSLGAALAVILIASSLALLYAASKLGARRAVL